jgi:hypothetical protein
MNLDDSVAAILAALTQSDLDLSTREQLVNSKIGPITRSKKGFFVELTTTSESVSSFNPSEPMFSVIKLLYSDRKLGEVILHSKKGKIQYMEVDLYNKDNWTILESSSILKVLEDDANYIGFVEVIARRKGARL